RLLFPRAADAVLVAGEAKAPPSALESKTAGESESHSSFARLGARRSWSLGVVSRDAKPSVDLAKAIATLVTKPAFASSFKKLMRDRFSLKVAVKPLTDKALPKGAFAQTYDWTVSQRDDYYGPVMVEEASKTAKPDPKAKPKPKPAPAKEKVVARFRIEDVIVTEGGRTFVAYSQNEATETLLARLNDAIKGTSKSPWSQRDGFAAFADTSAASGALIAIDGLTRLVATDPGRATIFLSELPEGGRGTFSLATSALKNGAGGTSTTSSFLSRDALRGAFEVVRLLDRWF
ncbi:MAG: hypothetical protein ABI175_03270, partial [Polyangiales bacterium]